MNDFFEDQKMQALVNAWNEADRKTRKKFLEDVVDPPNMRELKKQAIEVLRFVNKKKPEGTRPFPESDVNLGFIIARLREHFTVEDCKGVAALKAREWIGTDQQKWFRPQTLYNKTKFNQYIGELGCE